MLSTLNQITKKQAHRTKLSKEINKAVSNALKTGWLIDRHDGQDKRYVRVEKCSLKNKYICLLPARDPTT